MNVQKAATLDQVKQFAQRSKAAAEAAAQATAPTKTSELTNDSGFQTEAEVTAAINAKVSSTYRAGGSTAFADLPAASAEHLGMVYNVTDAFTTTDSFLEGAGQNHPAGTNVAVVASGEEYKYDVLAGFVDLSGYVPKEDGKGLSTNDFTDEEKAKLANMEFATDEEFNAMLDEVYGAPAGA